MSGIDPRRVGPGPSGLPYFGTNDLGIAALSTYGRARIGDCAGHNNAIPANSDGGSWLQSFAVNGATVTGWGGYEDWARLSSVTSVGIASLAAAHTGGGTHSYGVVTLGLNDGPGKKLWGGYSDVVKIHAGADNTALREMNVANAAGPSPRANPSPYDAYVPGMVGGVAIAAGSDASIFGRTYAVDFALEARNNGGAFRTGIIFRHNSIMRETTPDDTTIPSAGQGFARCVAMPYKGGVAWYSNDTAGAAGEQEEVARFYSAITSPNVRLQLFFNDAGLVFGDFANPASVAFSVTSPSNTYAGVRINASTSSGAAPVIEPISPDANCNLEIRAKGTGVLMVPSESLPAYSSQTAAAAGGVPIGGVFFDTAKGCLTVRRA